MTSPHGEQELPPLPRPSPPAGAGDPRALLRNLPAVHDVMADVPKDLSSAAPHDEWVREIRQAIAEVRASVLSGRLGPVALQAQTTSKALAASAYRRIQRRRDPGCVRVINATGVVLHTNLGRAAMPQAALDAIAAHAHGYQLLAADAEGGARSPRERHVEALLQQLTGCEAATVVNNNAAATMVALAAVGAGREVIVARGQLVEIGGAYRIPDVMRLSGATLREVGTTNRVHLRDYENAINDNTAAIMRVHTSNYRVEGFQGEVSIQDLVQLGEAYGIPTVDDLGSGALVSLSKYGMPGDEPLISESIEAGVDLITASGDKLIGGPQMGLLLGSRSCVARVRSHPFFRAIRCDKLTLIAMEATLRMFLNPDALRDEHPTVSMLASDVAKLKPLAVALAKDLRQTLDRLNDAATSKWMLDVVEMDDAVGAGSLPTVGLPGYAVRVTHAEHEAGAIAQRLRTRPTPVFCTVHDGALHLHVRTLRPGDDQAIAHAMRDVASSLA